MGIGAKCQPLRIGFTSPPGYIGVYTRQLQFGLQFPLHSFVVEVLNGYNISLCQLTLASIRRVMTFLWVCLFYGFEPSIHVFRKLHKPMPNQQSNEHHGAGWWRIETQRGYLTTWPNDTLDKDWQGQWIWIRPLLRRITRTIMGGRGI